MHRTMLAAAALAATVLSSPAAEARNLHGIGVPEAKTDVGTLPQPLGRVADPRFGGGFDGCVSGGDRFRHDGDRRGRGGSRLCDSGFYSYGWYSGGSTYDDRDWAPGSGNDWWNDRPERAYPRWVQEQHMRGSCDPDRMWWSGSGWHC
jgi:hypothetical protein